MAHDLRTAEGVVAYLSGTQWSTTRVDRLSGGTSSWTWRVHLDNPVNGTHTVVLKHVREYAALFEGFALSSERQHFEAEAIRYVHEINAGNWVSVASILHEDQAARALVLSDCGTDAHELKAAVLAGKVSLPAANAIGAGLGAFLARLHNSGRAPEAQARLAPNVDAVRVSTVVTYGQMEASVDPTDARFEKICEIVTKRSHEIASAPQTVTQGDFWPGNVLVKLGADGTASSVTVLDWELAKPGLAGLDVGQLCAELYYLERFSGSPEVGKAMRHSFLKTYRGAVSGFDMADVARVAATHIGAHHAVWTAKISPYKDHPEAKDVISQGIVYFVEGFDASPEWLRRSLVGELLAD